MKKTSYLLLFFLCLSGQHKPLPADAEKNNKKPPNLLIIFPDQLRRYSAGFWSEDTYRDLVIGKPDPVITPNIDKLAKNGVVFTQAIANFPLCSPYRGMLMSGKYPEQNGIWTNCRKNINASLRDDVSTITDLFYEAGYNTSYFGKCHWLRNEPLFDKKGNYQGTIEAPGGHFVNGYDTYVPPGKSRHNIQYFYQSLKDSHYNPHIYSSDPNTIEGKSDGELHLPKVFSPKNEAEKIIAYLKNKNRQRDSNKPFCMIWSINPPHAPWNNANTDMNILRTHYDTDKFPEIDDLIVRKNADKNIAKKYVRNYFAHITSVDAYIGLVLDELERMNELDNTIVMFSSDHGEMLGSHGKKGKNVLEMEAIAIPFIVHYPKRLKPGITTDLLFSVPDVLPTAMGLAGLDRSIPDDIEGSDFSDILINPESNKIEKPKGILLLLGNARGILTNRYTLCLSENKKQWDKKKGTLLKETFLYDNLEDPYQLKKIPLSERPEDAKALLKLLAKELKRTNDPWYQRRKYRDIIPYDKE